MRGALALVVATALVPMVLLQAFIVYDAHVLRRESSERANLEYARDTAEVFAGYVRDITRTEAAMGFSILAERPFSEPKAAALMERTRLEYKAVRMFAFADADGVVTASTDPDLVGKGIGDRDYFQELKKGSAWAISDVIQGRPSLYPTIIIAKRIDDAHGQMVGAMTCAIELDKLEEVNLKVPHETTSTYGIFDRQGNVVFVSIVPKGYHPNWREKDQVLDEVLKTGEERTGIITFPYDQSRRLVARVPSVGGYVVGASRKYDDVVAPVNRVIRWLVLLNMGVLGLSLLGAGLTARFIQRRLAKLRDHALAISGGDLSHRIEVEGISELAEVSQAMNDMAQEMEDRRAALERTVEDLKRSNQELEQFAYVASHDLQEPLRSITGFVQLLERRYKGKLDEDANKFIEYVVEAVGRLHQLINDLLAFSRVGSRGKPMTQVDLNAVLGQAKVNLSSAITQSGAVIHNDPLPTVTGDQAQLTMLLQNLLANAIKFRAEAPPEIHVSARRDGNAWVISVQDNGIGIEPQYFDQIFVIFQRLHTRAKYPGTGIGLAICRKIVTRHGGRIWVDSTVNEGSKFCFTLPDSGVST